jgi:hypothetical protein
MTRYIDFLKSKGLLNEAGAKDIEAKHEGITELPEGAWGDWGVEKLVNHFISLAKKKGKPAMSNAINNIIRWNKSDNKELSSKAREVMDKLMASKVWENI